MDSKTSQLVGACFYHSVSKGCAFLLDPLKIDVNLPSQ